VQDLVAALPFYESVLGFRAVSRGDSPHKSAVLARDQVQIGLAENGGDPTQDGCAFHVKGLESLFAEFKANGLQKEPERIAFARRLVDTTDRAFTLVTKQESFARVVRTRLVPRLVPLLVRLPPARRFMFKTLSQIGVNYRHSRLSAGVAGSVHGGDIGSPGSSWREDRTTLHRSRH
jgi:catechol 2,3-dioxygenase-like lactoylglutathione lyase family enzyme